MLKTMNYQTNLPAQYKKNTGSNKILLSGRNDKPNFIKFI